MILAQRASLLGELGKLRKNVALTEDQFKYVKMLILKDDPSVTMELLSTLRTFWEQRAEGILTDSEYNDQIIEAFGLMHSGDAHAVADYPEPLAVDLHSSKRKVRYIKQRGHCIVRIRLLLRSPQVASIQSHSHTHRALTVMFP